MPERCTVPCRVGFPAIRAHSFTEATGRPESIWATGCAILASIPTAPGPVLELRIYLPDGDWPLTVDRAHITWGQWDSFTVEFVSLPPQDQARLKAFLATDQAVPSCGVPSSGNARVP